MAQQPKTCAERFEECIQGIIQTKEMNLKLREAFGNLAVDPITTENVEKIGKLGSKMLNEMDENDKCIVNLKEAADRLRDQLLDSEDCEEFPRIMSKYQPQIRKLTEKEVELNTRFGSEDDLSVEPEKNTRNKIHVNNNNKTKTQTKKPNQQWRKKN